MIAGLQQRKSENQTLNEFTNLDDHIVISNPSQKHGKGCRSASVIKNKFHAQNLTQSEIAIPWGEAKVLTFLTHTKISH